MELQEHKAESKLYNIDLHPDHFGNHLKNSFATLYNSSLFSDVTLVLGKDRIPAHKVVLCSWSETFRAMLENPTWKESKLDDLKIDVEENDYDVFKAMLQFMYTGSLAISEDFIVSLLIMSNYYAVETLKESCGRTLGENLSEENVFYLLEICEKYDSASLRKECAAYLADNFAELLKSAKIMELSPETWAEMLSSDLIQVSSEEDIFDSVIKYCDQFPKEKRDYSLQKILPAVRFPLMSSSFLVDRVESNKSLQHLPVVRKLLHETFRYKVYPTSKPSMSVKPRKGFSSFDTENKPPTVKISPDGKTATYTGSGVGWVTINVLPAFGEENRYLEFKINQVGSGGVFVGVGSTIQPGINVGSTSTSWGYMSTGQIYANGSVGTTLVGYTVEDRIGIMIRNENGTKKLTFYKNGVSLGDVASFNNVSTSATKFYPQVTFYSANDSMTLVPTNGPEPKPRILL